MIHNEAKYFKLSYLKHHLNDEFDSLSHRNGIYYWVYWPKFDQNKIGQKDLVNLIIEFSEKKLTYSEPIKGKYKFEGNIVEQGFKNNGNLFGLASKKSKVLKNYLQDSDNIKEFASFFKELCFARPFYIGKANDLKDRLKSHFNYQSGVLDQIDKAKINHSQIWVGYKLIEDKTNSGLNVIFEEIFSRTLKPGLTKKPN